MTFNPNYAELLGRELQRDRMQEAQKARLVRTASLANPSNGFKVWLIIRDRWQKFWNPDFEIHPRRPIAGTPKRSPSL